MGCIAESSFAASTENQKTKGTNKMPFILTENIYDELVEAMEDQDLEKIESYLKKGLDIYNSDFSTWPLWERSISGYSRSAAVLELFIKYGADIKALEKTGYNAFHLFIGVDVSDPKEEDKITKILAHEGADIEARERDYEWTPLMHAILRGSHTEVRALLKVGADPNKLYTKNSMPRFTHGQNMLMGASADPEYVKLLLKYGADPLLENEKGQNAVEWLKNEIKAYKPKTVTEAIAEAKGEIEDIKEIRKKMYESYKQKYGEEVAERLPPPKLEDTVNEILAADREFIVELKESLKLLKEAVEKRKEE